MRQLSYVADLSRNETSSDAEIAMLGCLEKESLVGLDVSQPASYKLTPWAADGRKNMSIDKDLVSPRQIVSLLFESLCH